MKLLIIVSLLISIGHSNVCAQLKLPKRPIKIDAPSPPKTPKDVPNGGKVKSLDPTPPVSSMSPSSTPIQPEIKSRVSNASSGSSTLVKKEKSAKTTSKITNGKNETLVPNNGRSGRQTKLKELAKDDKLGSADRGWIQSEINHIERGNRRNIRNPPGKELAHDRGREAAKGYSYEHSKMQERKLHKLQHKHDKNGTLNKEKPVKRYFICLKHKK